MRYQKINMTENANFMSDTLRRSRTKSLKNTITVCYPRSSSPMRFLPPCKVCRAAMRFWLLLHRLRSRKLGFQSPLRILKLLENLTPAWLSSAGVFVLGKPGSVLFNFLEAAAQFPLFPQSAAAVALIPAAVFISGGGEYNNTETARHENQNSFPRPCCTLVLGHGLDPCKTCHHAFSANFYDVSDLCRHNRSHVAHGAAKN